MRAGGESGLLVRGRLAAGVPLRSNMQTDCRSPPLWLGRVFTFAALASLSQVHTARAQPAGDVCECALLSEALAAISGLVPDPFSRYDKISFTVGFPCTT